MRQQFVSKLVAVMIATTVIAWMSLVAVPSAQRSETEGLKETATFLKAGTETSSAVTQGKMQVQKTLAAYNTLVTQPSKDMKGDYKKLLAAAKDTDQKVTDAQERITTMEAAGNTYFTGRAATIKDIQSTELREQAQQRLDVNQKQYATMLGSLREAGQSLHTLRTDLDNQITYLGSDLTPSAMTSLKPQAQKLNDRGAQVLAKADQAIAATDKYFDSIRPTKS
jgi:chromosome segregation ATPase